MYICKTPIARTLILTWEQKLMKKLNHNLTEEPKKRILIGDQKFYYRLQLLKQTRMDWQRFKTFGERKMNNSFEMKLTHILALAHLDKLCCHLQCLIKDQWKKEGSEFNLDTVFSFQSTPMLHWRAKTYSVLRWTIESGLLLRAGDFPQLLWTRSPGLLS